MNFRDGRTPDSEPSQAAHDCFTSDTFPDIQEGQSLYDNEQDKQTLKTGCRAQAQY